MKDYGLISGNEMDLCRSKVERLIHLGATQARVSLCRCIQSSVATLNGKIDSISRDDDCNWSFDVFLNGRYCTVSSNSAGDDDFLSRAIQAASLLTPDPGYRLPDKERKAVGCCDGREMDLYDPLMFSMDDAGAVEMAEEASIWGRAKLSDGISLRSEEGELSRNSSDTFIVDSDGFEGRKIESSASYSSDVVIEDSKGDKYSDRWWNTALRLVSLECDGVADCAVAHATAKAGPERPLSGKYAVVVDTTVSSHLMSPLFDALDAYNLHYGQSFLEGCRDRLVFNDKFCLVDHPHAKGESGSALFDSEGVATFDLTLVENGVVRNWYMDNFSLIHSDLNPSFYRRCRPGVSPFMEGCEVKDGISLEKLLKHCGKGLYITDFVGGNCNPVTGDFSYGVSGLAFDGDGFTRPFSEVLMSGNIRSLFQRITAAGTDQRPCMRYRIPSLAFADVDINA